MNSKEWKRRHGPKCPCFHRQMRIHGRMLRCVDTLIARGMWETRDAIRGQIMAGELHVAAKARMRKYGCKDCDLVASHGKQLIAAMLAVLGVWKSE